jgi:hypothetical protein
MHCRLWGMGAAGLLQPKLYLAWNRHACTTSCVVMLQAFCTPRASAHGIAAAHRCHATVCPRATAINSMQQDELLWQAVLWGWWCGM